MNNNIKLGVIGLGFVGGAMTKSFTENGLNVVGYDKFKNGGIGKFETMLSRDVLFLCLPTPYSKTSNSYDLSCIHEVCGRLLEANYKGLVVLKSTVEPGTTEQLVCQYNLKMIHNPEFLTARTAYEDFHTQDHIVLGKSNYLNEKILDELVKMYKNYYTNNISVTDSTSSESMKILCNSFYASKIMFFNEVYLLCQKMGIEYNGVRNLMLKNNWINPMHTNIPGPDGQLGFGGACFPKDTHALRSYLQKHGLPNEIINSVIEENDKVRGVKNSRVNVHK